MVEAEDAMKWWVLRPDAATYDFGQGDELVRFAQAHGMKVRGHCLVWGRSNPEWLTQGHFTALQLSRLLHEHIDRVMSHYAGQVFAWDVVTKLWMKTEMCEVPSGTTNRHWISGHGTEYIEQVLRWAHEADPHALLFYNEAEGEGLNRKSDAIYTMVKDFKRLGIPIDGVGLQMHISLADADIPGIAANISANIARLTALGVQVHITELDVSLPLDSSGLARAEDLSRQADVYRAIVRACLNSAGCTAIQTWGFTDKYSWIGSHSRGARGQALPFDRAYQPKAAYRAVLEEILAGRSTRH